MCCGGCNYRIIIYDFFNQHKLDRKGRNDVALRRTAVLSAARLVFSSTISCCSQSPFRQISVIFCTMTDSAAVSASKPRISRLCSFFMILTQSSLITSAKAGLCDHAGLSISLSVCRILITFLLLSYIVQVAF